MDAQYSHKYHNIIMSREVTKQEASSDGKMNEFTLAKSAIPAGRDYSRCDSALLVLLAS